MTESRPEYNELKSREASPTTLELPVELKVSAKAQKTSYILYNCLASLEFIISILSLIFYIAFHFSELLIIFSALGTLAVSAGCFFSYLAISRIDSKKQTVALIAFCLAAALCFTGSIISLNLAFRDYKPVPNIAFYSTEPAPVPIMPAPMPHPKSVSEPAGVPYSEPAHNTDGVNTDSSTHLDNPAPQEADPNAIDRYYSASNSTEGQKSESNSTTSSSPAYRRPYRGAYPSDTNNGSTTPDKNGSISYSSWTSYSTSYTYSYSDPYPYSISYSYTYSNSSSPYDSSYSVWSSSSYDNPNPYGQPSYSNQYSYSGSTGNGNVYPYAYPAYDMPQSTSNTPDQTIPVPPRESITPLTSGPTNVQYADPTINTVQGDSSNATNPYSSANSSDSNSSEKINQNIASTSTEPHAIPAYMPDPIPLPKGNYSSYSFSYSYSSSSTYSYSNPYPYSITNSYTYSNSSSSYGSSYSIFNSSSYDNPNSYGQPSYSSQYSYSSSTGNGYNGYGNGYTYPHPYLRPAYAYTTYQPSYAYDSYAPENLQTQSSYSNPGYSTIGGYGYSTEAAYSPMTNLYTKDNVDKSSVNSPSVALSVVLFIVKTLLFIALITQAYELRSILKQKKLIVLEESAIRSESQII